MTKILIGFDLMLSYILLQDDVEGIESVFRWIEKLGMKKYTDYGSLAILTHFVSTKEFKRFRGFECIPQQPLLYNYQKYLLSLLEMTSNKEEKRNVKALFMQLNQIIAGHADYLITDNLSTHNLAKILGIEDRIYTIENFLEICNFEHRDLDAYKGLTIKREIFGKLNFSDHFFDTFKKDYDPYYETWLKKKAKDEIYVAFADKKIKALLKLKTEGIDEDYKDIEPSFSPGKRLKISSMKVDYTGEKLGQRFLHIIFMQAVRKRVDEIYVTIVNQSAIRRRLINLLKYWGFKFYGIKGSREEVYVRNMKKEINDSPFYQYPFQSLQRRTFIIPLGFNYSQQLLPTFDTLNNEQDVEPYKSAIRKTIVLQNVSHRIGFGCNLLFYQNHHSSCGKIIASGIVCNVKQKFPTEEDFIRHCRKRCILTLNMLSDLWHSKDNLTVVDFLYNYSLVENSITDDTLLNSGIDLSILKRNQVLEISNNQFCNIIKNTTYEKDIIIDKA